MNFLETAMAVPNASNCQPWHFVVVMDRGKLDELADDHPYGKMLFEALLCIMVCGDPSASSRFLVQNCSAAAKNLFLAVVGLELGAVWLGVHPSEEREAAVRRTFYILEEIIPLNLISFGNPAKEKESRT